MTYDLANPQNAIEKVVFREQILTVQNGLQKMIESGETQDTLPDCVVTHYFAPKDS